MKPFRGPAGSIRPPSADRRRARGSGSAWPGDEPAWCRPGAEAEPSRCGACGGDDRASGGAGVRRWGRAPARDAQARLPHPALRTPGPYPWPRAPALGASACSVGCRSSKGTCVRKARVVVGRKTPHEPGSERRKVRIPRRSAESTPRSCNRSCTGPEIGSRDGPSPHRRARGSGRSGLRDAVRHAVRDRRDAVRERVDAAGRRPRDVRRRARGRERDHQRPERARPPQGRVDLAQQRRHDLRLRRRRGQARARRARGRRDLGGARPADQRERRAERRLPALHGPGRDHRGDRDLPRQRDPGRRRDGRRAGVRPGRGPVRRARATAQGPGATIGDRARARLPARDRSPPPWPRWPSTAPT